MFSLLPTIVSLGVLHLALLLGLEYGLQKTFVQIFLPRCDLIVWLAVRLYYFPAELVLLVGWRCVRGIYRLGWKAEKNRLDETHAYWAGSARIRYRDWLGQGSVLAEAG